MNRSVLRLLLLIVLVNPLASSASAVESVAFDVVIYGGTSAAVATAVQVRRMDRTVAIVCPEQHLGGLTTGGLGWTDSGKKDAIGGVSREFYHRIWKHYQDPSAWTWQKQAEFGNRNQSPPGANGDGATMWVFEPHAAEQVFEELIAELDIPVFRGEWLNRTPLDSTSTSHRTRGVTMSGTQISAITMESGKVFQGRMFVDATYEGDLLAAAGVSFHVGREANSVYGETWNGIQVGVLHHAHFFRKATDPYVTPGDPASGLLPCISSDPPGIKGDGDHRIQAYCFRMCLTNVEENRIPFSKPDGYDAAQYELLLRVFDNGWRELFQKFDPLPNHKTDTNNHGPFSTDNIGMNYDYPEGSYEQRRQIIHQHEVYQKGLLYFMASDPRVPADVRDAVSKWGLAKDEFRDNGGWPHQIYVREARRMVGRYVMTEHDCLDRKPTPESIGMGSYTLDSHNVQRYVTPDGTVQNEGDIGVGAPRPYEISYGSIVPQESECTNLLVPVCVSSSHIAFGSIRMEPVFMILGQSAGTAACMALVADQAVQDVPYEKLRQRLLADGQVLEYEVTYAVPSKKLPGIVVDDNAAMLTGNWSTSSANQKFVDSGYRHNSNDTSRDRRAVYEAKLSPGQYEVRVSWPANANRATNVPIRINHADGVATKTVNQRLKPPIDDLFQSLGTYRFEDVGTVEIGTQETDGYVILDAVQFLPVTK
ncbi:MAG: FAD-dependent oxidoreductase [Planctomycetaceae bacterium]